MSGITKSISFTVDTEALRKMAREAEWDRGNPSDLHEIKVTESGLVTINSKSVFDPNKEIERREYDAREIMKVIERLKSEGRLRPAALG